MSGRSRYGIGNNLFPGGWSNFLNSTNKGFYGKWKSVKTLKNPKNLWIVGSEKYWLTNDVPKLSIVTHRSYLYLFLVKTIIKVNTASRHFKLLYDIRFGTSFVSQYFSIPKIHRFVGVFKVLTGISSLYNLLLVLFKNFDLPPRKILFPTLYVLKLSPIDSDH